MALGGEGANPPSRRAAGGTPGCAGRTPQLRQANENACRLRIVACTGVGFVLHLVVNSLTSAGGVIIPAGCEPFGRL